MGGLLGGHSGTEIDKEHSNAIKLLGITLQQIHSKIPFKLADINVGEKDNAIPREASAVVCIAKDNRNDFIEELKRIETEEKNEKKSKEKHLCIKAEEAECSAESVMDNNSTDRVLAFLVLLPNGVQAMSADIEGLVETSLDVGILRTCDSEVIASSAIRSAIETAKHKVNLQLQTLTKTFGGYTETHGEYPGWQFDPESKLRSDMVRIYRELFGKEVRVEALHAGLECGIMISKIPGLDCVSFGPDIFDIHTTEERLSISSTARMWDYLLEILKSR